MQRLLAAATAAVSCAWAAQAEPATVPDSTIFTLERAYARAAATAPSLEAASATVRAAEAARTIAGLRPNPTFDVQMDNIAGSGAYDGFRAAETTVSVGIPLEIGGKRSARIAAADAGSARVRIEAAAAAADLRLDVAVAYIGAVAATRRHELARAQALITAGTERAAATRVEAGRASPIEVQRATVARIVADASAESAAAEERVAQETLARRIGGAPDGPLDLAWFDRVQATYGPRRAADGADTLTLAMARADVALADAEVSRARAERLPDITLSAGARRFEESRDTAAVVGLSVPIPVFNGGRSMAVKAVADRDRARAQERSLEIVVAQAIAEAELEVETSARTAAAASGPALAAAEETARIARIGYREGKFGQIELLDAERTRVETRAAAIAALAAYHNARARLERLTAPATAGQ